MSFGMSFAQTTSLRITGTVSGYTGQQVYLAMMYGGNQYMVDTATAVQGTFTFESRYKLQSGAYLVILPPTQSFIILVDQNMPGFSFTADVRDINNSIQFTGAPDNTEYYNYFRFFEEKRLALDQIKKDYDAKGNDADRSDLLSKMQTLKKDVVNYQNDVVQRTPGSMTAAMVKCEIPVEVPVFDGTPDEVNLRKYMFQRYHYFDNIDLTDERLIRAPKNVLVDRVHFYLDNMTPQHPDSIIASVDYILARTEQTPVSYRFFLTDLFNKYRESKSIGMDAVFAHIAEDYIAKGKAPWIDEKEKTAVLQAVSLISPTLIGKIAPDLKVQLENGQDITLQSVVSPYTVLVFWSPDCAHCQQSIPVLQDFYTAWKDKGVKIFAVCTATGSEEKNCWSYLHQNQMDAWINTSDMRMGGKAFEVYHISTTPRFFILDQQKKILAKDMGVEHLDEILKRLTQK